MRALIAQNMLLTDQISNFIKQIVPQKVTLNNIDREKLEVASSQLWSILKPKIQYLSSEDQVIVELAFTQMVLAHGEMRRKSGEYYIIHPVAACITLTEIQLDKDTLAACLLHDVPEDTAVTLKDLSKDFSSQIVFLVEGITKLSVIKYKGEDRYAENLRRMFVAMSEDLRVIFIKLADRLHNLKTLKHVKPEKQKRIALESLEIYAPIAEKLGINYFRGEIEDAAFPYVYPDEYKQILSISDLEIKKRTRLSEKILKKTEKLLKSENIPFIKIMGRPKKYFSIFKKVNFKGRSIDQVYDLVALRIVTDSVDNCYRILSSLHKNFEPVEGRVKDYIARPKPNGYQSIHTVVRDSQLNLAFEFQIRTLEMHDYAEYGVASHWVYKDGGNADKDLFLDKENLKWISELVDLGKEKMSEEEYLQHVKLDLFHDRIFVMTPKNDVLNLPKGATALDFAFKIHEEIGLHATMAKVDGEIVKLNQELPTGAVVEIITDKRKKPNLDWLKWVRTHTAAKHIKTAVKKAKKTEDELKK
jgi:GTP diphosphokinase / guanosine-3',5'-bis(diphosphate) 3'-diphosphatase